jgi:hypothetical protein
VTREEKAIDILNKWGVFFGQRAGRELWADKPTDIQNQDIADFNRDVQLVRAALREQPRWISVEERLPETYYQDVLVYDEIDGCQFIAVLTYQGQWLVPHYEGYNFNITHWMPLPDAPGVEV